MRHQGRGYPFPDHQQPPAPSPAIARGELPAPLHLIGSLQTSKRGGGAVFPVTTSYPPTICPLATGPCILGARTSHLRPSRSADAYSSALNYNRARAKIKATFTEPMLRLPASTLPEGPNWESSPKLDGYRALTIKTDGKVHLRFVEWTQEPPATQPFRGLREYK